MIEIELNLKPKPQLLMQIEVKIIWHTLMKTQMRTQMKMQMTIKMGIKMKTKVVELPRFPYSVSVANALINREVT